MKRSHKFFPVAAVLGIGLCVVVYRSVQVAVEAPVATSAVERPQTQGSSAVIALQRELAQLRAQVLAQQRAQEVDPRRPDVQDRPINDPRTDLPTRAEQQRQHREYIAGIEAAFRKERPDLGWSAATASAVQSALGADGELGLLAHGVECRARTCRIEIDDDGSSKLGKLLPTFAQKVGQDLPSVVAERVEGSGGAAKMVLYLFRRDDAQTATIP